MFFPFVLAVALVGGEPSLEGPSRDAVVRAPALARTADVSFLLQRWDRVVSQYGELVEANPTVGLYWWRLGMGRLESGQFDGAIAAFNKSEALGAFQWNPPRMIYRGESAWGLAAAHALAGHKEEAIRWTRTSLAQGLRDIRRFQGKHFASLADDPEYRKLVWSTDVKGLSRDEGYRHDLRFLLHEAKRIHYAPFRATSDQEFEALAQKLSAEIPQLSDEQIFVRMMAIVRRLDDGHSVLRRTGRPSRLPLQFFRYPEGLYITAALSPNADLVGAKVLRIGDRSTDEALNLVEDITSRDNPMTLLAFTPWVLSSMTILRGLEIVKGDDPVPLEVEDAGGKTRRVELAASDKIPAGKDWICEVAGCGKPLPLSSWSRDKTYWFADLPEGNAMYCQINGIGTNDHKSMSDFCKELFEAVSRPEVETLVLDLRYNGGGDTFTNPPLIEGIMRSEKLQKPGSLFVIIGRDTFSAAQNTTSELERRTKAILVGEPTGSRPNFIGESLRIPLPYSGWVLGVSDLWWQHSMAMDYRVWTPPHLYAPPTAAAFRSHVDPCLEVIARYRAAAANAKK